MSDNVEKRFETDIYIYTYDLITDAVSSTEYVASNGKKACK